MFRYLVAVMLLAVVSIDSAPNPHSCPENEEWNSCGRVCEPSCAFPSIPFCPSLTDNCLGIASGCRCKHGYVRDQGKCVWVTSCTNIFNSF